jgi:transcriptional regulator with XRE-family HTH domain
MEKGKITGKMLREWRVRRGWKRIYLAEKLGLSDVTVWKMETADYLTLRDALAVSALAHGLEGFNGMELKINGINVGDR